MLQLVTTVEDWSVWRNILFIACKNIAFRQAVCPISVYIKYVQFLFFKKPHFFCFFFFCILCVQFRFLLLSWLRSLVAFEHFNLILMFMGTATFDVFTIEKFFDTRSILNVMSWCLVRSSSSTSTKCLGIGSSKNDENYLNCAQFTRKYWTF